MAKLKTVRTNKSVAEFLRSVENRQRRADAAVVKKMMRDITGKRARMWGTSIVGYGSYDYRYASGRSGSFMLTGFSPRKQNLAVYIMPGFKSYQSLLSRLGKHKTGKSCLYINKLDDVDQTVLRTLIERSVRDMRKKYAVE